MDGKAIAATEPEQVHVTIESKVSGDSIVIERTLPKKEEQASKAKDKHTAKSSEAKLVDGVITFSHTLKDIGFDSALVSSDTLKLRFASDAQGSLSVSSASRAKDAKQKDRIEGSSTLTDPSKPADAANPPSIHTYTLERVAPDDDLDTKPAKDIPESFGLPFGPFALEQPAQARLTLLVNGTLWTNTAKADENDIVPAGTLVLRDGKIVSMLTHEVGMSFAQALAAAKASVGGSEDALVIDCTGKHITPGLIDAHSHTGISQGLNEGGQAVTSEVRIEDVTNPDDVNWYRQLAGGVTSVLNLHGSANAIGGQSQVNKLRWGCAHPDDIHFVGAIPGIKFALGENPRQVNWDRGSDRYPKTRMGVETLIRDRFTAAREYAVAREKDPLNTRRDLELEALAEILAGKRLIHCHSYRQDEIVMLTHVARDFGFKIGTFQHILEGYKVADYVRDYSGGGSGFTDWWAFKQEVQDAIPAGLPLMQKVGATTSFNSDSNNLARFMNVEAAKAVRYGREVGGFTEAQALRFVTLNPAKQLRIDDRVGKLQNGYDADVVVWTRSPLSTFSLVEATFVDGKLLFSREMDAQARKRIASERDRLIAKLVEDPEAKKAREKKDRSPDGSQDADAKADESELLADLGLTAEQAAHLRELYLRSLTSGRVPTDAPGLCGCGLTHAAWVQQR
jgi:imidazolonepropionase-like amidohydrolase